MSAVLTLIFDEKRDDRKIALMRERHYTTQGHSDDGGLIENEKRGNANALDRS